VPRLSGAWGCAAVLAAAFAVAVPVCAQDDGLGLVREPDLVYKSFDRAPRFRAFLPPSVDLSPRFPVAGSQGRQSSCVAWAVGYSLRSYYEGKRRNWSYYDADRLISPAFIYNRLHNYNGNCSLGTSISAALQFMQDEGAPPLAAFPYVENDCSARPDPAAQAKAGEFRIRSWQSIEPGKLDDIKGQLARGNPVVFGMQISESFRRVRPGEVYDDTESPRIGGHAMVIVGYSEEKQAFRLLNSWGTRWGEGGLGWVSYRAVGALSDRLFVMDVPGIEEPLPPVAVLKPEPPPVDDERPRPEPVVKPPPVVVAPPPPVVKPPPAPVPVVSAAELAKLVTERAARTPCSKLEASVSPERAVGVRGFTGAIGDLAALRRDLLAMPGVKAVETKIDLFPWPQCEVLLNFARPLAASGAPRVELRGATAKLLRAGDSLEIEITTPPYPSHLYVTYLQASGDAVHLYWPAGRFPKALPPGSKVTLGGGKNGEPLYRVGAPFGDEVIVVVASASPLFEGAPPESATDREYLTAFRRAFVLGARDGSGNRVVSASALLLKTEPRRTE